MNDKAQERRIDQWLKSEGLDRSVLAWSDSELIHAVRIARRLLAKSGGLLAFGDIALLRAFVARSQNRRLRCAISKAEIYGVMTLGKPINRHQYRQRRASKRR
jgi:hypothetical protein